MSSPAAVPKPANPGASQIAIANVKNAFVNVRSGPGTQYADIGDIRDNTLVVYYPDTRTDDDWFWTEQSGLGGWVAGSVTVFEPAVGVIPTGNTTPTPYDGKVALWHWKGQGLPETTIEQFAANIKLFAPNVKQIWVKTSDGSNWMGDFDNSAMAIRGVQDVARWVSVLQQYDLEFHAWCVPKGLEIAAEASIIGAVCNVPGVESMILDVEPYAGFWQGGSAAIRPFMTQLRRLVGGRYHIGMSMDPRPWHFDSIFPDEWFPFINSVHPQSYWQTFRRSAEETLQQTYDTWGNYGRPVIPALQGDAAVLDQQTAHTLSTQRYGAQGLSWWRYGVISRYDAINTPVVISTSPAEPNDNPTAGFADEKIVFPGGDGFRSGTYTGRQELTTFQGTAGWDVMYKATVPRVSTVWAEWKTELPESGRYEISTYIPARHATTRRARFKVHGIKGTNTEVVVDINQSRYRNTWVALGIFDLVKGAPNAGKVFLNDVTGETTKEIAFDAIRFRRIVSVAVGGTGNTGSNGGNNGNVGEGEPGGSTVENGIHVADGFDPPIGTVQERRTAQVWPPGWRDATGYGPQTPQNYVNNYRAYHTGVDLNYGSLPDSDFGMNVFSSASGVVVFANSLSTWGNIVIIQHDPLRSVTGLVMYGRYAHLNAIAVQVGQRVTRGQVIGTVGKGEFNRFAAHLHFDLSPTTTLTRSPGDWPGLDLARLQRTYVDPKAFIINNRPR